MGLYDHVHCKYPLPDPQVQDLKFQTKSTDAPYLDNYEITADGRLLRAAYETRCIADASAPFGSHVERENRCWEPVDFRGQLEIHTAHEGRWYSYLLWFKDGRIADLQHGLGHGESLPLRPLDSSA